MRRWIATAVAILAAACTTASSSRDGVALPAPVVLDLPGLEGVDPSVAGELRSVENLISEGSYVAARSLLDRVLARPLDAKTVEVAQRLERIVDLDPSFLPLLSMLERAVQAGDDREARAILEHVALRRPRGRIADLVEGYRRILDGREIVGSVRLALEFRPEALPSDAAGKAMASQAPKDARFARLYLVARTQLARAIELEPGPGTLVVTRTVVGSNGLQQDQTDTRTWTSIRGLRMEAAHPAEVPLGYFFAVPPETGFATRLRFDLELRSGDVRLADAGSSTAKPLPAMRLRVEPAEERALATSLESLGAAAPEELAALAKSSTSLDPIVALKVALRIPPEARARTLDLLAPLVEEAPIDVVRALVPSLRWIALTGDPGSDPSAWRAWLREREAMKKPERQDLVLPEYRPQGP